ncbi:MAG: STAS domain-containing protein [Nocardioidaceae bacterium]
MDARIDGSTLKLSGDLDVRTTGLLRSAVYALLEGDDATVVVDLTDVDSIDLIALRVLAVATRQAGLSGRHVVLRGCCPAVRRFLHVSRLFRALEVERDRVPA